MSPSEYSVLTVFCKNEFKTLVSYLLNQMEAMDSPHNTSLLPLHYVVIHILLNMDFSISSLKLYVAHWGELPVNQIKTPTHLVSSLNINIPLTFQRARPTPPHHFVNLKGGISSKEGFMAPSWLHMIDSAQWSLCTGRRMPHCGPTVSVWNKTRCQAFQFPLIWLSQRRFQEPSCGCSVKVTFCTQKSESWPRWQNESAPLCI